MNETCSNQEAKSGFDKANKEYMMKRIFVNNFESTCDKQFMKVILKEVQKLDPTMNLDEYPQSYLISILRATDSKMVKYFLSQKKKQLEKLIKSNSVDYWEIQNLFDILNKSYDHHYNMVVNDSYSISQFWQESKI